MSAHQTQSTHQMSSSARAKVARALVRTQSAADPSMARNSASWRAQCRVPYIMYLAYILSLNGAFGYRPYMDYVPNGDKVPCTVPEISPSDQLTACSGTGVCEVFGHERCEASGSVTRFGRLISKSKWDLDCKSCGTALYSRTLWPALHFWLLLASSNTDAEPPHGTWPT